jgi:L-iditol 2-dehydrogenase
MGADFIVATDIMDYRLKQALKFGADKAIDAQEYYADKIRQLNQGRLFDLVIVSTGAMSAIGQALESVDRSGTVLFFAPTEENKKVTIPFNDLFWRNGVTLTSSYAGSPKDYQQALDLIASKKLKISDMITHRLGLAETFKGFQLVAEAKESIKVIIYPQKK